MDNATNATNANLPSNEQPYITEIDVYAMATELKLRGFRYFQIAEELRNAGYTTTEMTLEHWFSKGGKCYEEFLRRRAVRTREMKQRLDETDARIKEIASDALTIIHKKILKGEMVDEYQLKAAQDILDRAGYPKQSKTELSGQIESESMNNMASAIKSVLEAKKPLTPAPVVTTVPKVVEGQIIKQNG